MVTVVSNTLSHTGNLLRVDRMCSHHIHQKLHLCEVMDMLISLIVVNIAQSNYQIVFVLSVWASQVAPVVKNSPANARNIRDVGKTHLSSMFPQRGKNWRKWTLSS